MNRDKLNQLQEGVNKSITALENMQELFINLGIDNIKYNFGEGDFVKIEKLLSILYDEKANLQYFIDKEDTYGSN